MLKSTVAMRESEIVVMPHSRSTAPRATASMRSPAESGFHSILSAGTPATRATSAAARSHNSTE